MASAAAKKTKTSQGAVVTYAPQEHGYRDRHERVTRIEIGKRLAALKGYAFAGEYDRSARYSGPVYFIPSDTLLGPEATDLGIRSEHDLFGGVVPYRFVATKAITHSLVGPNARAPTGWSHEFGHRVQNAVLFGFTVFTHEDARYAGACLLERGPARTKPARASAGRDQTVISRAVELDAVLDRIEPAELSSSGLVLEEDLTDVVTYSVGQVRVAELVATYHGVQRLTTDNHGEAVYGGSDLVVARGEFEALLRLDLSDEMRLAVSQACLYDTAAMELYPGLFVSRRNYDVAAGLDAQGQRRCGVLEQSWRMGGASGAEIAALEAFRAEPTLDAICASTFEAYGESNPPQNATVYFRGVDERTGPMTKYTIVESYGDAR
jgi:hypothetical protein